MEFAGLTDRGRMRARNEDALLMRPARGLFAVADGMGGHAGGDVASRIAVDVLDERLLATGPEPGGDVIAAAIRAGHEAILRAARADRALDGMGTTLTALQLGPGEAACTVGHIGDSRAYRLREGALSQLTRDQTWVQEQVDLGTLTPEQARTHPRAAILTDALGIETIDLEIQILEPACEAGDLVLLCSDGLVAGLTDTDIADILTAHASLDDAARALIDTANAAGGPDNITVALVRIG